MKLSEKIQEALREQQEINLSDPAVQKRLAAQWGYVPAGAQPAPSLASNDVSLISEGKTQPAPSIPDGWLRAIDEALVVAHIGVANESDTYEQAKAKLNNLICFHVDVATDPAVNGGWKLVPVEILDRFPEINQNNYNHDDVCNLNAWGVELVLAVAPEAKP